MTRSNAPLIPHVSSVPELRQILRRWRRADETIALVPTMGALHDGHVALVNEAKSRVSRVVASIFVNPTQFAPHEDFSRYPRTLEADLRKLEPTGCDLVWAPGVSDMYPEGFATRVVPAGAADGLETDFRPHFFGGVATVCTKLFVQVAPDEAVFGEKDYQQLCVVKQVVRDLDLPMRIVGAPTIRESDGLAMSSRNRYLSPTERAQAPKLYRALTTAAAAITGGCDIEAACATAAREIAAAGFGKIDYVAARQADTLAKVETGTTAPIRLLAAAWLGTTRLIDNIAV